MNNTNDIIIDANHISKVYQGKSGSTMALKDISFTISRGNVIGYVGENGAGKSTTIKLLLGLILPNSGQVTVFGNHSYQKRKVNAAKIGVVMGQKSQLWWELPLEDSFAFLQSIYNTHDNEWLNFMIDKLNVRDFLTKPVRELSLGQRMRGELLAALLHRPELVILDEDTIGLDSQTKNVLLNFLVELNHEQNVTIFMTTHDLREVERVANHIILIDSGEKIYNGRTSDFVAQYAHLQKLTLYSQEPFNITGLKTYQSNIDSTVYIFDKRQYTSEALNKKLSDEGICDNKKYESLDLTDILSLKSGGVEMRTMLTYLQATFAVKRSFLANNWLVLFAAVVGATVQYYIWHALGNQGDKTTLTSYGLFAILFNLVVPMKVVADALSKMINDGNIAVVLSKPIRLTDLLLGTALGDTLYSFLYKVMPLALIYFVLFHAQLSFDLNQFGLAIPSIIMAWLISWLTGNLIGITVVYTVGRPA